MASQVLRQLSLKLQESPFICIMIDEITDITNKEQVTIVFRSVSDELEVDKDFVGFYTVSRMMLQLYFLSSKILLLGSICQFTSFEGNAMMAVVP